MNNDTLETRVLQSAITIAQAKAEGGDLESCLGQVAQALLQAGSLPELRQAGEWVRGAYASGGSPLLDKQGRDMSAAGKLALVAAAREAGGTFEQVDAVFLSMTAGNAAVVGLDWPQPEIVVAPDQESGGRATPRIR